VNPQLPLPITVIFTTYNEAPNIQSALESVATWASEILVVDSFSTDGTVEIIEKFGGVRLLQRAYFGPADQKNWAIPQAKNEWVLLMDADERATLFMRDEIAEILRGPSELKTSLRGTKQKNEELKSHIFNSEQLANTRSNICDGYWIGFTHFFMGKKVRFSGWQNDKTIRLIHRDKCRYNANRVHEEIVTDGLKIGRLTAKFDHYTFRDIEHFVQKQQRYAAWSAIDHDKKTGTVTAFHFVIKPFFRFFKHYFLKLGFLDGKVGFIIAAVAAWSVFLRYVKIVENRQLKKQNNEVQPF
jgi:glycosyltransferase involved in cell wall biosynthesis